MRKKGQTKIEFRAISYGQIVQTKLAGHDIPPVPSYYSRLIVARPFDTTHVNIAEPEIPDELLQELLMPSSKWNWFFIWSLFLCGLLVVAFWCGVFLLFFRHG